MSEQRQLSWYRQRLGEITGSQVGRLMKKGKSSYFSEDGQTYIYQLAAERSMASEIIDDDYEFEAYLEQVNVETKAMRFGTEMEAEARKTYCEHNGVECDEVGLCSHFDIEHFASSPDGIVRTDEGRVALEIKCPTQAVYMRYYDSIWNNETLKKVKPEYYYQCLAHMMCTGAIRTDFIIFNPFQSKKMKVVQILPDHEEFKAMTERIEEANETIEEILKKE